MPPEQRFLRIGLLIVLAFNAPARSMAQPAHEQDTLTVGLQPDGQILVPTNQMLKPTGKQITFPGRPVDLAFADDGQTLIVKNRADLVVIDTASGAIKQTLPLPVKKGEKNLGFGVVGIIVHGGRVYVGDNQNQVRVAEREADGSLRWQESIALGQPKVGGFADPAGMALQGEDTLWVASTRGNDVQRISLKTGKVEEVVPVGVAPYMICCPSAERCYVSNWGGNPPAAGDPQAKSSNTPIRIDPKTGVANQGTVSVLSKVDGQWKQTSTIPVGLHPCGMVLSKAKQRLYVANANSDSVSVIDTEKNEVVETIACRPEARLPFGSGSNALALSPDGRTLYVANGTNNCIAVVALGTSALDPGPLRADAGATSKVKGLVPTGWYPGAILVAGEGKKLIVANIKGHGSLSQPRPVAQGKKTRDYLGSVSFIDVPDSGKLARLTEKVNHNNRLAYSLSGLDKPRTSAAAIAVPQRHGEPSIFKHVFYIIKENRTYDQVFGDIKEGNGDPNLVMFGENVTPNHHALAREFTLLDNFYCSGVLSADGHSWVNEAYVTDYLERAFGGFTRSYPDEGSDPLAYPATGFLWGNALAHGKTLRNYGEFVNEHYAPPGTSWTDIYKDVKNGTHNVKINVKANMKPLEPFTHPRYPWFPLLAPDQYRAQVFLEELQTFEKAGNLPNLIYITLPCDHTAGTRPGFPTPRAMVADNDLALGRIVEGITKSQFWPRSCIFVVEDDPQDGFDHVDAHRTVALVISPFTKREFVDHTNYNQTGMVKTIELMLRLPPMTQLDLSATPMRNCFRASPDVSPYTCRPSRIPLDEMNPSLEKLQGKALHWARESLAMNLDEGDAADEDTLNRILWHSTRGYDTAYPERFAGKGSEEERERR
jgi:YVTN family beta-propeller protein